MIEFVYIFYIFASIWCYLPYKRIAIEIRICRNALLMLSLVILLCGIFGINNSFYSVQRSQFKKCVVRLRKQKVHG